MSKSDSITRHHLIIKKLRRRPMTFQEISDALDLESELQEYGYSISQRTFQRDIKDIHQIYKIVIKCDRSTGQYRIKEEEDSAINKRIFEAYDTFHALNLSEKLSQHIHFEHRKPQGTENLHGLLHAIKKEVQINFIYYNFLTEEENEFTIEPYALKEFRNRWYLIGYDINDEKEPIGIFGLDRLKYLEITNNGFTKIKNFDVNEYFRYCFGIFRPNADKPDEIILSFPKHQGKYIKSLPLHDTQEILIDTEEEFRVKLKLFITYDLEMELRSLGEKVKVIKPERLKRKLTEAYQKAINQY